MQEITTNIDKNELFELEILKQVERSSRLNTRLVAAQLGCNVRLAHSLLKKLVSRGCLHVKKLHSRRWDYYLTPKGISEKARKTYRFFEFSMQFYQDARHLSSKLCEELKSSSNETVAFIGAGNLAEIVYVSVQEWNLNLIEVFGEGKDNFIGCPLSPFEQIPQFTADAIIVCIFDKRHPILSNGMIKDLRDLHWIFD